MSTLIKNKPLKLKIIGKEMPQSPMSSQGRSTQPLHLTPVKCSSSPIAGSPMSLESSSVKKQKNRKYVEYWCKYCDKYFKHKNNMRQHERTHTNERPYSCAICGKSFKKSSEFAEHRRRHSGQHSAHRKVAQKSHQCHDCGKTFNHKGSLVKHARTHSNVKEFYCELCDKDFKHKSTYDRHKLMHSGVKKFVCDYCQKGFFDKSDFKKHILCHTQNSKFRGFKRSNADKNHLGTIHPVKDTPSTAEKELNADITKVRHIDPNDNLDQFGNDSSNLSMRKMIYKTEPLKPESCQENNALDYSNDVQIKEEIDSHSTIHDVEVKNGMKETLNNESHFIHVYQGREIALVHRKTSQNAAGNSSETCTFSHFRSAESKDNGVNLFHGVDLSKADNLYSNSCKGVQVAEYENTVIMDIVRCDTHTKWRIKDEAYIRNVQVNCLQDESRGINPNATLEGHDVRVKREIDEISAGIDQQTSFHEDCRTVVIGTKFENGYLVETQSEALPIKTVNIVHSKPSPDVLEINKIQPLTTGTVGKSEQSFIPILTGFETVKERHVAPDIKTNIEESKIKNIGIGVSSQNIAKQMNSSQRTRQQTKCNGIVKSHFKIQTDETSDDSDGSDVSSINSDSEGYEECTAEEIQAMLNNMKEKKTL